MDGRDWMGMGVYFVVSAVVAGGVCRWVVLDWLGGCWCWSLA